MLFIPLENRKERDFVGRPFFVFREFYEGLHFRIKVNSTSKCNFSQLFYKSTHVEF